MKLRNKHTGLVGELHYEPNKEYHFTVSTEDPADMMIYKTLTQLNDDWEDYKPAEPLIKDEKIRKAVRAWADAVGRQDLLVIKIGGRLEISDGSPHLIYISFHADEDTLRGLDDRTYYTIAELCGEEEE